MPPVLHLTKKLERRSFVSAVPALALAGFVAATLAFAAGLLWERLGPTLTVPLAVESIVPYQGYTYAARVDRSAASFTHASRRGETRLLLFENGVPLPGPGADFDAIAAEGAGRYAASGRWLLFAPHDNSDPRENGRRYEAHLFPGLSAGLLQGFLILAILCAGLSLAPRLSCWTQEVSRGRAVAAATGAFALIAAIWSVAAWTSAPQIVTTGDGGNVASIIAAKLHPERFEGDPVFADPENYAFYQTLLIPLTRALTAVTGDVGQAYMSLSGPLVLVQMIGFFLLGRRLFGGVLAPLLLALATIPPIFVLTGELWGMLSSPLTRSLYAAPLPYLLLAALAPYSHTRALALMALCGATVYVHPVSAPSVAFGILAMLFVAKPESESWPRHTGFITLCGSVFLAVALPFALTFAEAFPTGSDSKAEATAVARELLRANVGPQYYDVTVALAEFAQHFWLGLLGAAIALVALRGRKLELIQILAFAAGVAAASIGVSFLDQTIAAWRGSDPVQIDLIRNIRFLVPVALILIFWALAKGMDRHLHFAAPAIAIMAGLWIVYPTPVGNAVGERFVTRHHPVHDWLGDAQAALRHLALLPPGANILPLPHEATSEGLELANLAVRYGAYQQVVFQTKDMNFLAYSSSDGIITWNETRRRLDAAAGATPEEAKALLRDLVRDRAVTHILVYAPSRGGLRQAALAMGPTIAVEGDFTVVAVQRD
ncbi:MAG TPA: hypothetical protein PLW75_05110 [Hyphomicrobium sp.]|nr:hypothetical protein [Hyphomicrobium sp.]